MYKIFFKLNQAPFSIAPDPRYLYMSECHREALAHLLYGVNSGGGFVLLTGEIGTGKTTVCRCFLEQIPDNCNVAYIFNPKLTVQELLQSICDEFQIEFLEDRRQPTSNKNYVDALNSFLLASHAAGKNNVLVIDEAQNLSEDVLEQLRLLTNLETNERKLLQIILIGQPELRDILADPNLEQLSQRVIAHFHLGPLSMKDTANYILHRLSIAGLAASPPFSRRSVEEIYERTNGIPRKINLLCDRALLGAYSQNKNKVDSDIVNQAAGEMFAKPKKSKLAKILSRKNVVVMLAMVVGTTAIIAAALAFNKNGLFTSGHQPASVPVIASKNLPIAKPASVSPIPALAPMTALENLNSTSSAILHDEGVAYKNLAQFWKVSLPEGDPCTVALANNLHCYQSDGGIDEIRQLDRPVILTLHDETNNNYFALLTGLSDANATLQTAGKTKTISLIELSRHFRGHVSTFWQAPPNYREKVRIGFRGDDVDWLAVQMALVKGLPQPPAPNTYTKALSNQVRAFQLVHGLEADGVVGPKTYMHINAAVGINEPRLQDSAVILNASKE